MLTIDIELVPRINHNPDNGPIGNIGWLATVARPWEHQAINGCPLGRGLTQDGAANDLIRRIKAESKVSVSIATRIIRN